VARHLQHSIGTMVDEVGTQRTARGYLGLALLVGVLGGSAAAEEPPSHLDAYIGRGVAHTLSPGVPRVPWRPGFLPASFVTDRYAVDVGERAPRDFAGPVNRTRYGSLNLLPRTLGPVESLSLGYETERVPALGEASSLIRLKFEIRF
jgi:hypothetical protein